jgi:hypothetical protein
MCAKESLLHAQRDFPVYERNAELLLELKTLSPNLVEGKFTCGVRDRKFNSSANLHEKSADVNVPCALAPSLNVTHYGSVARSPGKVESLGFTGVPVISAVGLDTAPSFLCFPAIEKTDATFIMNGHTTPTSPAEISSNWVPWPQPTTALIRFPSLSDRRPNANALCSLEATARQFVFVRVHALETPCAT